MRKNLETRKLVLHRETLACLDDPSLLAVAGGTTYFACPPTRRISECKICPPPPPTDA
jgi:hypothetical protein